MLLMLAKHQQQGIMNLKGDVMSSELTAADVAEAYLSEPYDVKIGVDGSHWFVGVKPPITEEMMARLGSNVMRGWAVEEFDPATVFRKHTDASKEATYNAALELVDGLMAAGAECVMLDKLVSNMQGVTSPFDGITPEL